jgi:hypothetical protein
MKKDEGAGRATDCVRADAERERAKRIARERETWTDWRLAMAFLVVRAAAMRIPQLSSGGAFPPFRVALLSCSASFVLGLVCLSVCRCISFQASLFALFSLSIVSPSAAGALCCTYNVVRYSFSGLSPLPAKTVLPYHLSLTNQHHGILFPPTGISFSISDLLNSLFHLTSFSIHLLSLLSPYPDRVTWTVSTARQQSPGSFFLRDDHAPQQQQQKGNLQRLPLAGTEQ